eukprot:9463442-Alexandrium_andersonii.AAC.1
MCIRDSPQTAHDTAQACIIMICAVVGRIVLLAAVLWMCRRPLCAARDKGTTHDGRLERVFGQRLTYSSRHNIVASS